MYKLALYFNKYHRSRFSHGLKIVNNKCIICKLNEMYRPSLPFGNGTGAVGVSTTDRFAKADPMLIPISSPSFFRVKAPNFLGFDLYKFNKARRKKKERENNIKIISDKQFHYL